MGNFSALKHEIAEEMAEINRLVKTQSADKLDARVLTLIDQVKHDTDAMVGMADPRFTEVIYEQQLDYVLTLQQLEDGPTLNPLQRINQAQLVELYNFSKKAVESLSRAKLTFDASHVHVHVTRPASLLEICQLPDALMISLTMKVQALFSIEELKYNLFTGDSI